jgi:hypothetical protein
MRTLLAAAVIPYVKSPTNDSTEFVLEILPHLLLDFLDNRQYHYIWLVAFHQDERFRKIGQSCISDALNQKASRFHRVGMVEADILDQFKSILLSHPQATDIKMSVNRNLPSLAIPIFLCGYHQQILTLLRHEDVEIRRPALTTLRRICDASMERKTTMLSHGLIVCLLSTPSYPEITEFTREILESSLGFFHSRDFLWLIALLNHLTLQDAAKSALQFAQRSSDSEKEALQRSLLLSLDCRPVVAEVVDFALGCLPAMVSQVLEARDVYRFVKLLEHPDPRFRRRCKAPLFHAIKSQDGFRHEVGSSREFRTFLFRLCESSMDDDIDFVVEALTVLAIDFVREDASRVFSLFNHPNERIRGVARPALLSASKGPLYVQRILLKDPLDSYIRVVSGETVVSEDLLTFVHGFIKNIAKAYGESTVHCSFLFDLLSLVPFTLELSCGSSEAAILTLSRHPQVALRDASRSALTQIIQDAKLHARRPLRIALFSSLYSAREPVLQFALTAQLLFKDAIAEEETSGLVRLWCHPDARIRDRVISSLALPIEMSAAFRIIFLSSGFISSLLSDVEDKKMHDDVLDWSCNFALPLLVPSLWAMGRISEVIRLLGHKEQRFRTAAEKFIISGISAPMFICETELDSLLGNLK